VKPTADWTNNYFSFFAKQDSFVSVVNNLSDEKNLFSISGLYGSSISLFIYSLFRSLSRTILVVTNDSNEAEYIRDDLDSFPVEAPVCFLPPPASQTAILSDVESLNSFFINDTLKNMSSADSVIIIATFNALNIRFPSLGVFNKYNKFISIGDVLNRDAFVDNLYDLGYTISDVVEEPFEFCIKGGIIDFFPPDSLLPFRIEFFGDTIESIRSFNPETQLSINKVNSFSFHAPAKSTLDNDDSTTLFSYLKKDTIVFFPHGEQLEINVGGISYKNDLLSFPIIRHNDILSSDIFFQSNPISHINNINDFKNYLHSIHISHPSANIAVYCSNSAQIERLSILIDNDHLSYVSASISRGFEIPEIGLYVFTEHELFKRSHKINFFNKFSRDFSVEKFNPNDIAPGDLIVHINYGVGRFSGLLKIMAMGSMRECLSLEYFGGDKVFVPLEKLNYVQKYIGGGSAAPPLNKLGTTDWERTKLKSRRAVEDISKELISLYAKRVNADGFAFLPDTDIQVSMESEFIYEETPDQVTAIQEIKKDMERKRPMDRLLCGDVGFGKTEVAIRASFKAVSGSKQVAVLVPTTILADQHFAVFSQRLNNYPVNIALISRFVPRSRQIQILKDLADGKIDIIIGTHRLLSKDVLFNDLGLLIIDEEHRFGVKDKERIKTLRASIDVLALSATPIPRSLHFSLIGARDFSVINTPPVSRLPVFTEVITFDSNFIKNTVMREINRGGQVFFVHNDIKTISALCKKLSDLLPDISIAYAHGQMGENDLEKIMRSFIVNEINLLVTTTIIESGIDIPNANTIFINNAHHYGLAQLYQLRGRVGRSSRRAYAYLIIPDPSRINSDGLRKLQTIKKYSALGSGYNIALQDLEIRGAGNLFGPDQSGNIQAIGYELYTKILREALDDFNSNEDHPAANSNRSPDVEIFCSFPAFLPDIFVSSPSVRLDYYRQLSSADDILVVDNISSALQDIYGKIPAEGQTLISISKIRALSAKLGLKRVNISERSVHFIWNALPVCSSVDIFLSVIRVSLAATGVSYKYNPHNMLHLVIFPQDRDIFEITIRLLNLLVVSLNL